MDTFACSQVQQFIIAILDLAVILKIQFRLLNMTNNNTLIQFKKIFYNSCPAKLVHYFICSFAASSCCSLRVVKQRKISIVTQSTSPKLLLRLVHGNERKTFATKDKSHLKEYPEFFFFFFFSSENLHTKYDYWNVGHCYETKQELRHRRWSYKFQ